jgi:hypothetical protein
MLHNGIFLKRLEEVGQQQQLGVDVWTGVTGV